MTKTEWLIKSIEPVLEHAKAEHDNDLYYYVRMVEVLLKKGLSNEELA